MFMMGDEWGCLQTLICSIKSEKLLNQTVYKPLRSGCQLTLKSGKFCERGLPFWMLGSVKEVDE